MVTDKELEPNKIVFDINPMRTDPMLVIGEDGFWVRGTKVEQGPEEARQVYTAFQQWLAWSALNRQY